MATKAATTVIDALQASGAEVLTDSGTLDYYAHDVYDRGTDLAAVVRPADKQQLSAAVAAATSHGHAVIPRGGGMSYTGGLTAQQPQCVLFDLKAMDRIVDVNETDMTVTVEPGCSWSKLYDALQKKGLRTPFWGTLSGLNATVGGGMSQNAIFWGSGRHGTAAQSCIAMEVVLADGTIMTTGSDFARPYGPDLTGIFLADTGAMAMKASITLRLVREAKAHGYASFTFETHGDVLAAMAEIERADIATECFGFDPNLNAIRMQRDSMTSDAKQLVGMMKKQGSVFKALKEGAKVVTAGRNFMGDAKFSLHVLAEGRIQAAADDDINEATKIAVQFGGTETENTIPKIIRANPFGPLNSMLGPQGERWAPIHGLLPHSKAAACYSAVEAFFASRRTEMDAHGIHHGTLIAAVGGAGTVIEPCLYWPDARNPVIEDTVEEAHIAKLPVHEHSPENWALVQELKQQIIDLLRDHGAIHFQIGRAYPHNASLDPRARVLLQAIKGNLDPQNHMNPGSLGIGGTEDG